MTHSAGWFPGPTRAGTGWRWWDGSQWTIFTEQSAAPLASARRKPRLPRWLSVPVVIVAFVDVMAVLAGLVPLAIVLPVVAWLDRVEPEPRASPTHALMWGAWWRW
jgi:hypothetical protein